MNASNIFNCPKCNAALPADAPQGLCPRCLAAMNLATETVLTGADALVAHPPLSPSELAPHFPQLEVIGYLGRGGMGVVYQARQKSLNRLVALKLLAPERVQDAKFAERFTREAQALAALNHPNIVTVYDFGQAGGFYFLLMEFVDGVNLRQLLRERKFGSAEALTIVPPICEALQYAHEHGIVHRDIKPENLLLDKGGRVKIADFGIAKMLGANGSNTGVAEAQPTGTPAYMAPEQRNSPQSADHRADIYSLGVVLYELLTGELPQGKLQPLSRKVHIEVRLDEIVLRALEQKPELRFQTVAEMRGELAAVATRSQQQAAVAGVPPKRVWQKWIGWAAFALPAPFVVLGVLVVAWLISSSNRWNSSGHEAALTLVTWLGVLALVLPFLVWKLLSTDRQSGDNPSPKAFQARPAMLRVLLWTMVATLLAVFVGGIVVRSYRARNAQEEATRVEETQLDIVRKGSAAIGRLKLRNAEAELERLTRLYAENLVSREEVSGATFEVQLARAELAGDAPEVKRVRLSQAEERLDRAMKLQARNLISQDELDKARFGVELAKAEMAGDTRGATRVRLRQAEHEFERSSELYKQNLISESEYNNFKLEFELWKEEFGKTVQPTTAP